MGLRKEIEAALSRIVALEKENTELKRRLAAYENSNTPSSQQRYKPKTEQDPAKPRFPGAPDGHKGAGIRIPKPDEIKEHTLKEAGLRHVGKRTQYVIDFVQQPLTVTKHIIHQYQTHDGQIIEPPLDLPKGIYGKNLQAFATLLKSNGVGFEKISSVIRALRPDLSICAATLLNHTDNIAKKLQGPRDTIQEIIRASPVTNADETVMRRDGQHGYNWVFCTPTHVLYETDKSRGRNVATNVLGSNYDGVVVSDGYAVYFVYNNQRCWAHILREADTLITENPEAGPPVNYLHHIFEKAKVAQNIRPFKEREKIAQTLAGAIELQHTISCLSTINGCKKFAKTLNKAGPNLFLGVLDPRIPLTNNHAERMLRTLVVHRKMMGCYRNEKGERFFENVMSNIMTWKLQGKPVYQNLLRYAR